MASSNINPVQSARYGILSEVVLLIASSSDLESLLDDLVGKIKWVLEFDRCRLALADDNGAAYELRTLMDLTDSTSDPDERFVHITEGMCGAVIQSNQLRLISDLSAQQMQPMPSHDTPVQALSDGSLLALPLSAYGKVLGALTFESRKVNAYSREDIKIATSIAAHLALAIDRALQVTRLQTANQELTQS